MRIFHDINSGVWGAGSSTFKEERLAGSDVGCKEVDSEVRCVVKTHLIFFQFFVECMFCPVKQDSLGFQSRRYSIHRCQGHMDWVLVMG